MRHAGLNLGIASAIVGPLLVAHDEYTESACHHMDAVSMTHNRLRQKAALGPASACTGRLKKKSRHIPPVSGVYVHESHIDILMERVERTSLSAGPLPVGFQGNVVAERPCLHDSLSQTDSEGSARQALDTLYLMSSHCILRLARRHVSKHSCEHKRHR